MANKNNYWLFMHGGKRTAGHGKKIGRPPSPYISKRVVLHFVSESEYQEFIKNNDPRQRVTNFKIPNRLYNRISKLVRVYNISVDEWVQDAIKSEYEFATRD